MRRDPTSPNITTNRKHTEDTFILRFEYRCIFANQVANINKYATKEINSLVVQSMIWHQRRGKGTTST